jgi:hypothetical protein
VRLLLLDADCFPAGRLRRFVRALQEEDASYGIDSDCGFEALIPQRSWCVEQSLQQLVWCSDAASDDAANDVGGAGNQIRDAQMRTPDASAMPLNRTFKISSAYRPYLTFDV